MSKKAARKVLVVDDEKDIRELLEYNLTKEGYVVEVAPDGETALQLVKDFKPAMVLLDIMMPGMDGVETCRQLRDLPFMQDAFIIFLTARTEEYSEVAAFDIGADDYITKPIKPRALVSRISALFRREKAAKRDSSQLDLGRLSIDRTSYTVRLDGEKISLPKKEFELLFFLAQTPEKVFSRDDLLKSIWGSDVYVLARTVDVHIRKVREKIGSEFITTVKGVGYKFEQV